MADEAPLIDPALLANLTEAERAEALAAAAAAYQKPRNHDDPSRRAQYLNPKPSAVYVAGTTYERRGYLVLPG